MGVGPEQVQDQGAKGKNVRPAVDFRPEDVFLRGFQPFRPPKVRPHVIIQGLRPIQIDVADFGRIASKIIQNAAVVKSTATKPRSSTYNKKSNRVLRDRSRFGAADADSGSIPTGDRFPYRYPCISR